MMNFLKRWLAAGVVLVALAVAVVAVQEMDYAPALHEKLLISMVFIAYFALWMAAPRQPRNPS